MHELAVVGLGLIGSAAVRHGSEVADVLGLGPAEPENWSTHGGPFASHYDSGRITRGVDARREWAMLAVRSIEQYPLIEQASGIEFHRATGVVFVRNDGGAERVVAVAEELGLDFTVGSVADQLRDLPELCLPADWTAVREPGPAGAIDPRAMAAGQLAMAANMGATLHRQSVVDIRQTTEGFELETSSGLTHQAREVLIAAGSYSNRFLTEPLAVAVRPEVVVLGELSAEQAAVLESMPSLLYLLDHPLLDDVYVVPPVQYPNGAWYAKIGGSRRSAGLFEDTDAMNRWMQSDGQLAELPALQEVLSAVLPGVEFRSWQAKPCLITDTASGLPYIDRLPNGMTVAFGGNGHAAKSSDAIGALGAALALGHGRWPDDDLPAEAFKARFGSYQPPTGSRHGT